MRRISTAKRTGVPAVKRTAKRRTGALPSRSTRPAVRQSAPPRIRPAVSGAAVERVTAHVLKAERRLAIISVSFLSAPAIKKLNRRWLGHNWVTDVVTFSLPTPDGGVAGDVYICPEVAKLEARIHRVTQREELIRLVIHGTLHVLGYSHPEGATRTRSPMWRRQERYVKALV